MIKQIGILCMVAMGAAYGASSVGLLPDEKVPLKVAESERNPFGTKAVEEGPKTLGENEEAKIRGLISKMPISGVMQGRDGTKVLLGSLVLEKDREVAPIISRQDERLKVNSISEEAVEIGFIESDGSTTRRTILVTLDVAPQIQFRLSRPNSENLEAPGTSFDGVITKDDLKPNP